MKRKAPSQGGDVAGPIVRFFDDGWRLGVVLSSGRKWITMLDYGRLSTHRVPSNVKASHIMHNVDAVRPRAMIASLRRRVREAKRTKRTVAFQAIAQAIDILKAKP